MTIPALENYSNHPAKTWPPETDTTYQDIIDLTIDSFMALTDGYEPFKEEYFLELGIMSIIRDQNLTTSDLFLDNLNESTAQFALALWSFHCLKRNINCDKYISRLLDYEKGGKIEYSCIYTYLAIIKFTKGNTEEYNKYKNIALEKINQDIPHEDRGAFDEDINRWAYIDMLIMTDSVEEAFNAIVQGKDRLGSKSFHVPNVLENIIAYSDMELLFKIIQPLKEYDVINNSSASSGEDYGHMLYSYVAKKIIAEHSFDKLKEYISRVGPYGIRMVLPVAKAMLDNKQEADGVIIEYLKDEEYDRERIDLLLLFATYRAEQCNRPIGFSITSFGIRCRYTALTSTNIRIA